MEPNEIFSRFIAKYSECNSYRDVGQVMKRRKDNNFAYPPDMTFLTTFERPAKMKFEWTKSSYPTKDAHYVLVSNGRQTWKHFSFHSAPQICESLKSVLGEATGISCGETRILPALLSGQIASRMHPKILEHLKLVKSEFVGTYECYCIVGSALDTDDTTLWLAMEDFSLRRHSSLKSDHSRDETTYVEVVFNSEFNAGAFEIET